MAELGVLNHRGPPQPVTCSIRLVETLPRTCDWRYRRHSRNVDKPAISEHFFRFVATPGSYRLRQNRALQILSSVQVGIHPIAGWMIVLKLERTVVTFSNGFYG